MPLGEREAASLITWPDWNPLSRVSVCDECGVLSHAGLWHHRLIAAFPPSHTGDGILGPEFILSISFIVRSFTYSLIHSFTLQTFTRSTDTFL